MKDNIIIGKTQTILRCILRVREEYEAAGTNFIIDFSRQDSAILNLQRAAQAAIDIAAHIVRTKGLSVPKETKDLFVALHEGKIISKQIQDSMIGMVGFRNISIHEYKKLDIKVIISMIETHLVDFEKFMQEILSAN